MERKGHGKAPPSRRHFRCCRPAPLRRRQQQFDPFEEEELDRLLFRALSFFSAFARAVARPVAPIRLAGARALDLVCRIRGSNERGAGPEAPETDALDSYREQAEEKRASEKGAGESDAARPSFGRRLRHHLFLFPSPSHPFLFLPFLLLLLLLLLLHSPTTKNRSRSSTSSPGRTPAPRSPSRCPREGPPSCAPGPTCSSSRARSRRSRC